MIEHEIEKPENWPANQREEREFILLKLIDAFIKNPGTSETERLLAFSNLTEINENSNLGTIRFTDFEVLVLNDIYKAAFAMNLSSAKLLVYRNILFFIKGNIQFYIVARKDLKSEVFVHARNLIEPLRIFFMACFNYIRYKQGSLAEELIRTTKDLLSLEDGNEETKETIRQAYIGILYDFSFNINENVNPDFSFNRKELESLFAFEKKCADQLKSDKFKSQMLKRMYALTVSNFVLKSRDDYKVDYLYKCMSEKNTTAAFKNKQIWMREIEKLNDKREGKIIRELFADKFWIKYEWAKKINVDASFDLKCYVSSFCNSKPDKKTRHMYGENVYGYKNDRIAEEIAPIRMVDGFPVFGLVLSYSVIYNRQKFKEDMQYLFKIIDCLFDTDGEKTDFCSYVLPYFYLSAKDKRWLREKERRYQLVVFPEYHYINARVDNDFLKVDSYLFHFPDFISKKHVKHVEIEENRKAKLKAVAFKDYAFCKSCLQSNFDDPNMKQCDICKSANIEYPFRKKTAND